MERTYSPTEAPMAKAAPKTTLHDLSLAQLAMPGPWYSSPVGGERSTSDATIFSASTSVSTDLVAQAEGIRTELVRMQIHKESEG